MMKFKNNEKSMELCLIGFHPPIFFFECSFKKRIKENCKSISTGETCITYKYEEVNNFDINDIHILTQSLTLKNLDFRCERIKKDNVKRVEEGRNRININGPPNKSKIIIISDCIFIGFWLK